MKASHAIAGRMYTERSAGKGSQIRIASPSAIQVGWPLSMIRHAQRYATTNAGVRIQ